MANGTAPVVAYDLQLLAEDMAGLGLSKYRLAQAAGVADMTVIRVLRGEPTTPATMKKLAGALGRSVHRYIVSGKTLNAQHDSEVTAR
jgi:transcriptional regulator with XRE-family HTH domain